MYDTMDGARAHGNQSGTLAVWSKVAQKSGVKKMAHYPVGEEYSLQRVEIRKKQIS